MFYQTPGSVTLQLGSSNQFTLYFSFANKGSLQIVSFNDSDQENDVDLLRVSGSIVYLNMAPVGEYQAIITTTVMPQGDTESATISLTVIQGIHLSILRFYSVYHEYMTLLCQYNNFLIINNTWLKLGWVFNYQVLLSASLA